MKNFLCKFFAIALIVGFSMISTNAQTPFNSNSKIIHVGLGLGGYSNGSCYSSLPAFSISYDKGLMDNLGIGNLGIGGMFAVKSYKYKCAGLNNSLNRILIGGRGHYHFDFVNSDNIDFYLGLQVGLFIWTGDKSNATETYNNIVFPGVFAGINYWFSPTFGIYGEFGYGIGVLNGGVAFGF